MIYLDYSATTPVNKAVLDKFCEINQLMYGNPNSTHELGLFANKVVAETTKSIENVLNINNHEVIYTSGATEANNLALKGYCESYSFKGKHIITSPYEHSSVTVCLSYLAKHGYDIDVLDIDNEGNLMIDQLEELIREDTILVTIAAINSELGIKQDLKKISEIVKGYPNCKFHSDMTQAIGKIDIDVNLCDLATFSAHKIYGIKGIGALLRKKEIDLTPVIHGGKSTTIFRGGTPPAPLIYSLGIALENIYIDFYEKQVHIDELYDYLINVLMPQIKNTHLNYKGIPNIVNISFCDLDATILHKALSDRQIYVSTQTACNSESSFSQIVKKITGSDVYAKTSLRISLSYLTKKSELDELFKAIKEILNENS